MTEIALHKNSSRSNTPTPDKSYSPRSNNMQHKKAQIYNIYLQLGAKILFLLFSSYLIYIVFTSISDDVSMEVLKQNDSITQRIKECHEEYIKNECESGIFIVLNDKCKELKQCMNTPNRGVGKSKVAARYFAILLNELTNPLSPKTVVLFSLVIILIVWFPKFS